MGKKPARKTISKKPDGLPRKKFATEMAALIYDLYIASKEKDTTDGGTQ